jgi:glycosyltransferase involved in cell wall biosynthesis
MRIAFVTPRFVTQSNCGLSSYLCRITRSLHEAGHDVEVFVSNSARPGRIEFHGIPVHQVKAAPETLWYKLLLKGASIFRVDSTIKMLSQSWFLCRALEARHKEVPFEAVQYADYLAVGLFMKKGRDRKNIIRATTAIKLYHQIDGREGAAYRLREWLELASIRRADRSYAPSSYVARFYRDKYSVEMKVIRPPLAGEVVESGGTSFGFPPKYFIHFGELCRRKGTYWLIESLKLAFEIDPSIRIIMVGQDTSGMLGRYLAALREYRSHVLVLHPLPKRDLYRLLKGARATIVPSLVDNLPNAAIESLLHGIPIIGSNGASIDEIVEVGVTGELAEINSTEELSGLIVKFWQERTPVQPGFNWRGTPGEKFTANALLDFIQAPDLNDGEYWSINEPRNAA